MAKVFLRLSQIVFGIVGGYLGWIYLGPVLNNTYQGSYTSEQYKSEYRSALKNLQRSKNVFVQDILVLLDGTQLSKDTWTRQNKNNYTTITGVVFELVRTTQESAVQGNNKYVLAIGDPLKIGFFACDFYTFSTEQEKLIHKISKGDAVSVIVKGLKLPNKLGQRTVSSDVCLPLGSSRIKGARETNNISKSYAKYLATR